MGRKRTWKRKHVFLYLACCVSLLSGIWGCSHFPKRWQAKERLSRAKTLLAAEEYGASLRETNEVLEICPLAPCDEALFQMGLIYAYPKNPERDYQRSVEFFQRAIEKSSQGRVKDQAALWVLFVQEIIDNERAFGEVKQRNDRLGKALKKEKVQVDKLKDQLLRLKQVDLGIEQKKSRVKQ